MYRLKTSFDKWQSSHYTRDIHPASASTAGPTPRKGRFFLDPHRIGNKVL